MSKRKVIDEDIEEVEELKEVDDSEDIDELIDDETDEPKKKKVRLKKKPIICLVSAFIVVVIIAALLVFKGRDKKYTVKFNTNGGSAVSSQKVDSKQKVSKPAEPTRVGYTFEGWYLNNKLYDFNSEVTSNITLEAKWTSNDSEDVSGVTLDQTEVALLPGDSIPLIATVSPSNAKDKSVLFKSSDESIVTVDNDGNITAKNIGSATITVTTTDGGFTAECKIVVSNNVVKVTGIILSDKEVALGVGESKKITATLSPDNATNKGVVWTSSDQTVASVSTSGVITGNKKGTAIITAATKDGDFKETISVKVADVKPESVVLNKDDITISIGEETTLIASILPRNASVKDVVWKSENSTIVSVNSSGKLVGKKEGTTNVVVTTKEGNKTAKCKVTVKKPIEVSSVVLDKKEITLNVGKREVLQYAVLPKTAANKAVKWSSSDPSVASINNGYVTALKSGTTTITITTLDGEKKAYCLVTVKDEQSSNTTSNVQDNTGSDTSSNQNESSNDNNSNENNNSNSNDNDSNDNSNNNDSNGNNDSQGGE